MSEPAPTRAMTFGVLGAVVGGAIGYFVFFWIVRQGFYALIVPAACLGFGAGLAARRRIAPLAIGCGIAGMFLGIVTEWKHAPFKADDGFVFFVAHLHHLKPVTLIMIVLGGFFAYRLALGFNR